MHGPTTQSPLLNELSTLRFHLTDNLFKPPSHLNVFLVSRCFSQRLFLWPKQTARPTRSHSDFGGLVGMIQRICHSR